MPIAKSDLELIKSKIDIVTFLEGRGTVFKGTGNDLSCICPIHSERTPSCHVKQDTQTFHCFGCGAGGDLFALVQGMDGLTFPGAVSELAELAGVQLQGEEDPEYEHRKRMFGIMRLATQYFRKSYLELPPDHPAKQNLSARKLYEYSLTDETIGFAPKGGLRDLMYSRGITESELLEVGLLRNSTDSEKPPVELFRNRLTWALQDVSGKTVGFSARKVFEEDNGPKYINSPQTPLYNKSKTLLGLATAKKTIVSEQMVYIVEGQSDVNALRAAGFENTVASCGTAFGSEHADILLKLSKMGRAAHTFKLVFCFDGDIAGTKAAHHVFEQNQNLHLNSYVVQFKNPDGTATDPCDFRKDFGDVKTQNLINKTQVNIVEFILTQELENWDTTTPEGQSHYIQAVRPTLALITDPIQYSAYQRKISSWTGIPLSEVERMLRQRTQSQQYQPTSSEPTKTVEDSPVVQSEEKLIASLIQYPEETIKTLEHLGVTTGYFESNKEFLTGLVRTIQAGDSFDYNDSTIGRLQHEDTGLIPDRLDTGLNIMIKSFLKYRYTKEVNILSRKNLPFDQLMLEQQNLKTKFKQ